MLQNKKNRYNFCINFLIAANIISMLVGFMMAFAPEIIFLKPHNNNTLSIFFNGIEALYQQYLPLKNWLFAIIGASIIGFNLLAICIIHIPLRRKEKWAYYALWIAWLGWFLIDSCWSIFYGANYNVWLINLPALVMISIPLILLRKHIFNG